MRLTIKLNDLLCDLETEPNDRISLKKMNEILLADMAYLIENRLKLFSSETAIQTEGSTDSDNSSIEKDTMCHRLREKL
jgi:hypothetical protein